jgi:antitoxin component of MazEF toxin-antitoxin module
MGCKVKVQKIERPTNKSFSVNFPSTIADAINLKKGEEMEWFIEDRNTFVLRRTKKIKSFIE